MGALGLLSGDVSNEASGVSSDGSFVVDTRTSAVGDVQAFRWTQAGGMVSLGVLTGYDISSAVAVSADGSAVAGVANKLSSLLHRCTSAGGLSRRPKKRGPFHLVPVIAQAILDKLS
jgi:probable HAF family extracellular repeat protein